MTTFGDSKSIIQCLIAQFPLPDSLRRKLVYIDLDAPEIDCVFNEGWHDNVFNHRFLAYYCLREAVRVGGRAFRAWLDNDILRVAAYAQNSTVAKLCHLRKDTAVAFPSVTPLAFKEGWRWIPMLLPACCFWHAEFCVHLSILAGINKWRKSGALFIKYDGRVHKCFVNMPLWHDLRIALNSDGWMPPIAGTSVTHLEPDDVDILLHISKMDDPID